MMRRCRHISQRCQRHLRDACDISASRAAEIHKPAERSGAKDAVWRWRSRVTHAFKVWFDDRSTGQCACISSRRSPRYAERLCRMSASLSTGNVPVDRSVDTFRNSVMTGFSSKRASLPHCPARSLPIPAHIPALRVCTCAGNEGLLAVIGERRGVAGAGGGLQVGISLDTLGAQAEALGTCLGMAVARLAGGSIHIPRFSEHILSRQLGGFVNI